MTSPVNDARSAASRSDRARAFAADRSDLVGGSQAAAEDAVHAADLRVKVVDAGGWTTMEYGIGRITLVIDEAGTVTSLRAG